MTKVNPNLGITFTHKYLRGEMQQTRWISRKQNVILRLNFCAWTDVDSVGIGRDAS